MNYAICFLIQSSRRFSNPHSLLGNTSHSNSKFQINDPIFKNPKFLYQNERFIAKLNDSEVKSPVNPEINNDFNSDILPEADSVFQSDLNFETQPEFIPQFNSNVNSQVPSGVIPSERPLNYYERKEILNRILYDKDEALIKDLLSKANPKDLIRRKPKSLKEKRPVVSDEELIRTVSLEDDSELVEDTGYEEPTQINHIRVGYFVFHRGEVYTVTSIQHIAQARAKGHYKAKMQLLHTTKENSFSFPDGCKMVVINPKKVNCEYSHVDESTNSYVFKTDKSEIKVPRNTNIGSLKYLKPGLKVSINRWKDKILNVFVPFHIEYKVVDLNTGNYAATLDNGLVVLVPTYIKINDHVEITTRACEFLRRTKIA